MSASPPRSSLPSTRASPSLSNRYNRPLGDSCGAGLPMIVCGAQHPRQRIEECVCEFTFLGKDDRNAALAKPKERIRANKYASDHYLRHAISFEELQLTNNGIGAVDPETDINYRALLRCHNVSERHESI